MARFRDERFEALIKQIQGAYQDWEDLCTVLKKTGIDKQYMKLAKEVFDKERNKK